MARQVGQTAQALELESQLKSDRRRAEPKGLGSSDGRNRYMLTSMRYSFLGVLMLTAVAGLAIAQTPSGPITFERIQNSNREPQNWLTYSGNNMGQRYSLLTQITPQNAKDLEMAWLWQARSVEKFEATSIVVDGILYTIQAPNDVVALDAKTGRPIWTFLYRNLPEARNCCGQVNRGLAILGGTLFMGTLDAHIIALDAKSGELLWKTKVADGQGPLCDHARSPVVKDKVIVGTAGGDGGAPRNHRGVRREDRHRSLALQHDSATRRARERNLERRFVEAGRRGGVEHRRLRSRIEPHVLGHRESSAGLGWTAEARRQSVQRLRGRAGRGYREAQVVLPVHSARRNGLRRDAGASARRHALARQIRTKPASQGDAAGPIAMG